MSDAAATPGIQPLTPGYRRYALTILLIIYTLNFLDRQIVTILAEPIRNDLGLSDTQLGALTGFAFALLYTVMGIPIARLAERGNRPMIISAAVAAWSGFTVLCGLATNYWQLLFARVGVGVGEAGCTPPAHSLITDYTPKDKRSSAIAFYHLGTPIGSLLGMVLGGVIADEWGWRTAFLVAGAPGAVIALVALFTLAEPRRKLNADQIAAASAGRASLGAALRELSTKKTFWLLAFAASIVAFNGYGSAAFVGSFFLRNHGAELTEIAAGFGMQPLSFLAITAGVSGGLAGVLGTWAGGAMADHLGRRDVRWHMSLPAIAGLLAAPVYVAALLWPSYWGALALFAIPTMLASIWYGPVYGTVQGLVHPRTRATAAAILLFVINLIGLGLGPTLIGVLSDALASSYGLTPGEGLRWSLVTFGVLGSSACLLFWLARFTIRDDLVS